MEDLELRAQVARLVAAHRDPDLLAQVPRTIAAQFGVYPLRALEGGGLEVACMPGLPPVTARALGAALGRPVRSVPCDAELLRRFLVEDYLKSASLNLHTFVEEDFLERPASVQLLREEKEKEPVRPISFHDPERLILLDFAYRSVLEAVDPRPSSVHFDEEKAADLPFLLPGEGPGALDDAPLFARAAPVPPKVLICSRESFSYAGVEHSHGWRAADVEKLPLLIHPYEVQVTGIEPDGSLLFYVYDRIVRVRPGETPRFEVSYRFLSLGQRVKRALRIQVYDLRSVPRASVRLTGEPLRWAPEHLTRWLGFDLA